MDEEIVDVSEEVVDPQVDNIETNEPVDNVEDNIESVVDEDVAEPQIEKPIQSQEDNAMFAKMRRDAESRARDNTIAEMGMVWNDKPVNTYAEYQQALKEKKFMEEAQQQGVDPQFYKDFRNMEDKLHYHERNSVILKQDNELSNDPVKGEFYKAWKDEVTELANAHDVDLRTAFSVILDEKLADVLAISNKKTQQDTITKISNNKGSTPGSLSSTIDQPSSNAWDMSEADFKVMMDKAARGELKKY